MKKILIACILLGLAAVGESGNVVVGNGNCVNGDGNVITHSDGNEIKGN